MLTNLVKPFLVLGIYTCQHFASFNQSKLLFEFKKKSIFKGIVLLLGSQFYFKI